MNIVKFSDVTKRYGSLIVLKNIELTVAPGEKLVVIGPSGSGKSTLLRCINALEKIDAGEITVDGRNVSGGPREVRAIRQEAGMVFQSFNLFPQMNALENVAFGPRKVRGTAKGEALALAADLLRKVGLAEKGRLYPAQLSGGQQQRVAIARALAVKPKLMLFDEPTSALDPELRHEVLCVMRELAEEGMTMIVVTHEIAFARKVGTRLLFMEGGNIVISGDPEELLSNPSNPRLEEFLRHVH
ncbi:MAG: glutamine ABC transporter ATP-binding protein GlnQ [Paraburkholderia sp.]|uniref:glutamine ABC transporter ATP-binding protein GlnQ n=1 Tax=Paraburkholderia sp. TaxID=1926495 RepID=UPI003C47AA89